MRSRMVNWLKKHKKVGAIIGTFTLALVLMGLMLPAFAQALEYVDVTGTYDVSSSASPRYTDNARHPRTKFGTLVISSQTNKVIGAAVLQQMGADIDLTGFVGPGTRPNIVLFGTDADGTDVTILARVRVAGDGTTVTNISGRIMGIVQSAGERYSPDAAGTSVISVASYYSEPQSVLLTSSDAGSDAILFKFPYNRLRLRNLTNLREGQLGFWFNLQNGEGPGPQMMLRFAPADSVNREYWGGGTTAYVDITVMPYQSPYTGTGGWLECDLATATTTTSVYYGNDPTDYTSFGGDLILSLAAVEAAINAETEMTAGGDSASRWVLTMVAIELWETGVRTCYIDDVTIGKQLYTLEPNSYYSGFRARPQ